ncbi:MAG TPA: efflux RND transporter permease subunit, partial [Roseiarcus sp.]|nr:efflux RND transporter permease subunit [Roseiarcus sp.]
MDSFNLSMWAIRRPALTAFLIIALALGGVLAYFQLGRAEDPSFTIKNVNVSATWPGATTEDMQNQVTDRIEKKLRELAYFDKLTTYTKPGFASIGVDFKDSTPAHAVPMLFLDLRK